MQHDCNNNQKVRGEVVVPFPWYYHDGSGFRLNMKTFIYKIIPKEKRIFFEVDFGVIWSNIQVGKENLI